MKKHKHYSDRAKKQFARKLRKDETSSERLLGLELNKLSYKFRKQVIVKGYIVDFLCTQHKLVVEVDGGYHNIPGVQKRDAFRTMVLEQAGYTVIRFTNEEVDENMKEVIEKIALKLDELQHL